MVFCPVIVVVMLESRVARCVHTVHTPCKMCAHILQFFIVLLTLCQTSEMFFLTLQKNNKYLSCNVSLWSCYKFFWLLLTIVPGKMILKLHVLVRHFSQNFEKLLRHVCPFVRPHGTTRLPPDGFSWNFIFEYFSKICLENSRFVQPWQEKRILYKKICVLSIFLPESFLEWVIFQSEIAEKIKRHFVVSNISSP
jgi:hypothetical protein